MPAYRFPSRRGKTLHVETLFSVSYLSLHQTRTLGRLLIGRQSAFPSESMPGSRNTLYFCLERRSFSLALEESKPERLYPTLQSLIYLVTTGSRVLLSSLKGCFHRIENSTKCAHLGCGSLVTSRAQSPLQESRQSGHRRSPLMLGVPRVG